MMEYQQAFPGKKSTISFINIYESDDKLVFFVSLYFAQSEKISLRQFFVSFYLIKGSDMKKSGRELTGTFIEDTFMRFSFFMFYFL